MDFEKDIEIDETALEIEWLNQPKLAMRYGKHWAQCQKRVTQAEEEVKLIRSRLIKQANTDPDKYLGKGIKATAPVVEAYYREHEDHIEAKKDLVDAQYEANIADIAKWEISNSRKTALENLVRLHAQHYFAGPSMPRDITIEAEKVRKAKSVDTGVGKALQRNKVKTVSNNKF